MLKKEELHFFNEIAYSHPPYAHCPTGEPLKRELKCYCDRRTNFDWRELSCLQKFYDVNKLPQPSGYDEELPLVLERERIWDEERRVLAEEEYELEMLNERMAQATKMIAKAKAAMRVADALGRSNLDARALDL